MIRCAIALLVLFAVSACAGTPQLDRLNVAPPADLPARVELESVPFEPQEDLYCGPASLAMVLSWSGETVTQQTVAPQVFTPGREGTLRSDMVGAARRNGRLAVTLNNLPDLLGELAAGHPVVVFQNLALPVYPQWHFAVAIGYDLEEQVIVLRSGTQERRVTRLSTFERTWQRGDYWALVVLPPDRLPATARLEPVLAAAAGLERAGRLAAAETAYRAIASRWTGDDAALIGLANTLYARDDRIAAERALRDAVRRNPQSAPAWNNLAVILGEQGQPVAAIAAAERAIEIDGGQNPVYRETLAELRPAG